MLIMSALGKRGQMTWQYADSLNPSVQELFLRSRPTQTKPVLSHLPRPYQSCRHRGCGPLLSLSAPEIRKKREGSLSGMRCLSPPSSAGGWDALLIYPWIDRERSRMPWLQRSSMRLPNGDSSISRKWKTQPWRDWLMAAVWFSYGLFFLLLFWQFIDEFLDELFLYIHVKTEITDEGKEFQVFSVFLRNVRKSSFRCLIGALYRFF